MRIRPLLRTDYKSILPWFEDAETQRRLGGIYPVSEQLKLIESNPDKHFWLALKEEESVGLIELEVEGDLAYPLILIAPAFRGMGLGHEMVDQLILLASQFNVKEIEAGIALDNVASSKCFERAGFKVREVKDGFNYYALYLLTDEPDKQAS